MYIYMYIYICIYIYLCICIGGEAEGGGFNRKNEVVVLEVGPLVMCYYRRLHHPANARPARGEYSINTSVSV